MSERMVATYADGSQLEFDGFYKTKYVKKADKGRAVKLDVYGKPSASDCAAFRVTVCPRKGEVVLHD